MENLEENITDLTRKKVGWIMEILEMTQSTEDAKTRIKRAVWNLSDEIKKSINQAKSQNDTSIKQ